MKPPGLCLPADTIPEMDQMISGYYKRRLQTVAKNIYLQKNEGQTKYRKRPNMKKKNACKQQGHFDTAKNTKHQTAKVQLHENKSAKKNKKSQK